VIREIVEAAIIDPKGKPGTGKMRYPCWDEYSVLVVADGSYEVQFLPVQLRNGPDHQRPGAEIRGCGASTGNLSEHRRIGVT
jgi:hypothetical protein